MDEITAVGIDLAKEVFAVCILDQRGVRPMPTLTG